MQVLPLLNLSEIDPVPKFIPELEKYAKIVKEMRDKEADFVTSAASRFGSDDDRKKLQAGLVHLALTEPSHQPSDVDYMVLICRDNLNYALSEFTRLMAEFWYKMRDSTRVNMIKVIDQLIVTPGANIEVLTYHTCKQMKCGDLNPANFMLIESMLDVYIKRIKVIEAAEGSNVLSYLVLTYLRLLPDYHVDTHPNLKMLKDPQLIARLSGFYQKASAFIVQLIRKHFEKLGASIGRDFIRLIYYLRQLTPFQKLWSDMFENVATLSSNPNIVLDILRSPTADYFVKSQVPLDLERQLEWMIQNVHCREPFPYKRYKDLLLARNFNRPEANSFRVCAIRFIVLHIIPTNEMINSTLLKRYELIAWLLYSCGCPLMLHNCLIALVFDWLWHVEKQNIMFIEPAVLFFETQIIQKPFVIKLFADFLQLSMQMCPGLATKSAESVRAGFEDCLNCGVIWSLNRFTDVLFRANRSLFDQFRTILGPLADTIANVAPPTVAAATAGVSAGSRLPVVGVPPDELSAAGAAASGASAVPLDPRLRRSSNSSRQPRPASPETGRFSPPVPLTTGLSSSQPPGDRDSPIPGSVGEPVVAAGLNQAPVTKAVVDPRVAQMMESFTSHESVKQKFEELRQRFQAQRLRATYGVKTDVNVSEVVRQFEGEIRTHLEQLVVKARVVGLLKKEPDSSGNSRSSTPASMGAESAMAEVCEALQALIEVLLQEEEGADDLPLMRRLADVLAHICLPLFDPTAGTGEAAVLEEHRVASFRLPTQLPFTKEQIQSSLASPVFVPLRSLCELSAKDAKREIILLFLTEFQLRQPRLGYHLLYFLASSTVNDDKMFAYRSFCASQESPSLLACLHRDMLVLADDNPSLFCHLLPAVYNGFASDLSNNADFLRLIVSKVDAAQLNYLISEILRGHLTIFHKGGIMDILKASLEWTSVEQAFFWQLVNAHELPTKQFLPLISIIDPDKHAEACSQMLLLLQLEKPTTEIVRLLLTRSASRLTATVEANADDLLSVTTLHYWGRPNGIYAQRFCEILSSMVTAAVQTLRTASGGHESEEASSTGRRRTATKNAGNATEQLNLIVSILSHLDCMRRNCKNIAKKNTEAYHVLQSADLQRSLQKLIASTDVPERVKDRFAELLSLVESDVVETSASNSVVGGTRGAGGSSNNSITAASTTARGGRGDSSAAPEAPATTSAMSKSGPKLRNTVSRRAAEAERRIYAATSSGAASSSHSSVAGRGKKTTPSTATRGKKSDTSAANNNESEGMAEDSDASSDEESVSDRALTIVVESNDSGSSSSGGDDRGDDSFHKSSSSESESDDEEEEEAAVAPRPVGRGKKRPAPGVVSRGRPASRNQKQAHQQQSEVHPKKKKRKTMTTRKAAVVADSDEEEQEQQEEGNVEEDESDSEDEVPRVSGRKMASRRLLDD